VAQKECGVQISGTVHSFLPNLQVAGGEKRKGDED